MQSMLIAGDDCTDSLDISLDNDDDDNNICLVTVAIVSKYVCITVLGVVGGFQDYDFDLGFGSYQLVCLLWHL